MKLLRTLKSLFLSTKIDHITYPSYAYLPLFFFHVKIKSGQHILLEGDVGLWHAMPSLVFGKFFSQYVEKEGA